MYTNTDAHARAHTHTRTRARTHSNTRKYAQFHIDRCLNPAQGILQMICYSTLACCRSLLVEASPLLIKQTSEAAGTQTSTRTPCSMISTSQAGVNTGLVTVYTHTHTHTHTRKVTNSDDTHGLRCLSCQHYTLCLSVSPRALRLLGCV